MKKVFSLLLALSMLITGSFGVMAQAQTIEPTNFDEINFQITSKENPDAYIESRFVPGNSAYARSSEEDMINKRRAIPLIVVIFLVCIVLALGLYHVFTSFDIKRSEDIVGAINVTTTGSSENIPLATSNNGDFSGIFFQEAEYNKLIILKKNWMTGRYSCWGTASTLSTVGTYQSVDSHNRIVVVYHLPVH